MAQDDYSTDDPDHTAEACMRKFSEMRPLFGAERDPGDEDDGGRSQLVSFKLRPGEWTHVRQYDRNAIALRWPARRPLPKVGDALSVGAQVYDRACRVALPWYRRAWLWLRRKLGLGGIHAPALPPIDDGLRQLAARIDAETRRLTSEGK